jgi:hypothetical protein
MGDWGGLGTPRPRKVAPNPRFDQRLLAAREFSDGRLHQTHLYLGQKCWLQESRRL